MLVDEVFPFEVESILIDLNDIMEACGESADEGLSDVDCYKCYLFVIFMFIFSFRSCFEFKFGVYSYRYRFLGN